eukprot:2301026-Ditylum_brightwellii.AAC.1
MGKISRRIKGQPSSHQSKIASTNEAKKVTKDEEQQHRRPQSVVLTRAHNIGATLIQISFIWIIVAGLLKISSYTRANPANNRNYSNNKAFTSQVAAENDDVNAYDEIQVEGTTYQIPKQMLQPFLSYPDPI